MIERSWYKKHEPKTIEEYCFNDIQMKTNVQKWINQRYISGNILLSGKYGTGKTSLSNLLRNIIYKCDDDVKVLSSKANVDEIRQLYNWVKLKPIRLKQRLVFIDELDKASDEALDAMKSGLLENYQDNCCFICTTNYLDKIPEPLISRFNFRYDFTKNNPDEVYKRICAILELENVKFDINLLKLFIDKNTDIPLRELITIMECSVNENNELNLDNNIIQIHNFENDVILLINGMLKFTISQKSNQDRKKIRLTPQLSLIKEDYANLIYIIKNEPRLNYDYIYKELSDSIGLLYAPLYCLIDEYSGRVKKSPIKFINLLGFLISCFEKLEEI